MHKNAVKDSWQRTSINMRYMSVCLPCKSSCFLAVERTTDPCQEPSWHRKRTDALCERSKTLQESDPQQCKALTFLAWCGEVGEVESCVLVLAPQSCGCGIRVLAPVPLPMVWMLEFSSAAPYCSPRHAPTTVTAASSSLFGQGSPRLMGWYLQSDYGTEIETAGTISIRPQYRL